MLFEEKNGKDKESNNLHVYAKKIPIQNGIMLGDSNTLNDSLVGFFVEDFS